MGNYESMMLPWSEIDTVMFDMDGTLLDLHFDNFFWLKVVPEHFSKHHGVSEEQALAQNTRRSKGRWTGIHRLLAGRIAAGRSAPETPDNR